MNAITRRRLGLAIGACAVAASTPAFPEPSPEFDIEPYLNPELRTPARPLVQYFSRQPPLSMETLAARRGLSTGSLPSASPPLLERVIPGRSGAPDVRLYLVNKGVSSGASRPGILHMHGGGFVAQNALGSLTNLQQLALSLDCLIVSVDYRLAPETRFPGSLEDNYAAVKWVYDNANELGVDRARIAVMGESAGGGHAAMLAIAARDRGEVPLAYQALIYPMLDDRTGSTRRVPPYMGALIWRPEDNRFGWTALLGVPAGSRRVPYGAVPARVQDLRGLPPAFISVGSIDLFVDEDIEYARRLIDAGIPAQLYVAPGAFHGFDMLAQTNLARQFKAALTDALRAALTPRPPTVP